MDLSIMNETQISISLEYIIVEKNWRSECDVFKKCNDLNTDTLCTETESETEIIGIAKSEQFYFTIKK